MAVALCQGYAEMRGSMYEGAPAKDDFIHPDDPPPSPTDNVFLVGSSNSFHDSRKCIAPVTHLRKHAWYLPHIRKSSIGDLG